MQRLIAMVTGRAYGKLYIACEHSFEVRSVPPQYDFSIGNFERLHALEVTGETAYLAAGREGIVIVDLSGKDPLLPKQPKIVGKFNDLPLEALDMSSAGNYLYVLCGNSDIWTAGCGRLRATIAKTGSAGEGMSYEQLQKESGLSYSAISHRLHRAKRKVREAVQKLLGGFGHVPLQCFGLSEVSNELESFFKKTSIRLNLDVFKRTVSGGQSVF